MVLARSGTSAGIAAVLWDMDGTIVDTEPYWIESEFEVAEKYGGTWSREHALKLVGNDLLESGRYLREHAGIDLEPELIVEELLDRVVARVERQVPWRPGATELLADLRAHDVPCAIVTMSYRRFVAPILAGLPEGTFDAVVTGDQVSRGKPHPEPYQTAAALLGWTRRARWPSRTPTPGPGPRRPPGAPSWWCPTTSRCRPAGDGCSPRPSPTSPSHGSLDRFPDDRCEIATCRDPSSVAAALCGGVVSCGLSPNIGVGAWTREVAT